MAASSFYSSGHVWRARTQPNTTGGAARRTLAHTHTRSGERCCCARARVSRVLFVVLSARCGWAFCGWPSGGFVFSASVALRKRCGNGVRLANTCTHTFTVSYRECFVIVVSGERVSLCRRLCGTMFLNCVGEL